MALEKYNQYMDEYKLCLDKSGVYTTCATFLGVRGKEQKLDLIKTLSAVDKYVEEEYDFSPVHENLYKLWNAHQLDISDIPAHFRYQFRLFIERRERADKDSIYLDGLKDFFEITNNPSPKIATQVPIKEKMEPMYKGYEVGAFLEQNWKDAYHNLLEEHSESSNLKYFKLKYILADYFAIEHDKRPVIRYDSSYVKKMINAFYTIERMPEQEAIVYMRGLADDIDCHEAHCVHVGTSCLAAPYVESFLSWRPSKYRSDFYEKKARFLGLLTSPKAEYYYDEVKREVLIQTPDYAVVYFKSHHFLTDIISFLDGFNFHDYFQYLSSNDGKEAIARAERVLNSRQLPLQRFAHDFVPKKIRIRGHCSVVDRTEAREHRVRTEIVNLQRLNVKHNNRFNVLADQLQIEADIYDTANLYGQMTEEQGKEEHFRVKNAAQDAKNLKKVVNLARKDAAFIKREVMNCAEPWRVDVNFNTRRRVILSYKGRDYHYSFRSFSPSRFSIFRARTLAKMRKIKADKKLRHVRRFATHNRLACSSLEEFLQAYDLHEAYERIQQGDVDYEPAYDPSVMTYGTEILSESLPRWHNWENHKLGTEGLASGWTPTEFDGETHHPSGGVRADKINRFKKHQFGTEFCLNQRDWDLVESFDREGQMETTEQEADLVAEVTQASSQGFTVQDATTHMIKTEPAGTTTTLSNLPTWDKEDWTSKPVFLTNVDWSPSDAPGSIKKITFPDVLSTLDDYPILNIIRRHYRVSYRPEYIITMNSTSFHSGMMRIGVIYESSTNPTDQELSERMNSVSALEFVANEPKQLTLDASVAWPHPEWNPSSVRNNRFSVQHQLVFRVVSQLRVPESSTQTVSMTVHMRFKDLTLRGLRNPTTLLPTFEYPSFSLEELSRQGQMFDWVKTVKDGIGMAANMLQTSQFGFPLLDFSGSGTSGTALGRTMTAITAGEGHVPTNTTTNFLELTKNKILITTLEWTTNESFGEVLLETALNPMAFNGESSTILTRLLTTCSRARGDFDIHIRVSKNRFQNGRLKIFIRPPPDENAVYTRSDNPDHFGTTILDLSENDEVVIMVPFNGPKAYKEIPLVPLALGSDSNFSWGELVIQVLNPLMTNDAGSSAVTMAISVILRPSFEVFDPTYFLKRPEVTYLTSADAPLLSTMVQSLENGVLTKTPAQILDLLLEATREGQMLQQEGAGAMEVTTSADTAEGVSPDGDSVATFDHTAHLEQIGDIMQLATKQRPLVLERLPGQRTVSYRIHPHPKMKMLTKDGLLVDLEAFNELMDCYTHWRGNFIVDVLTNSFVMNKAMLSVDYYPVDEPTLGIPPTERSLLNADDVVYHVPATVDFTQDPRLLVMPSPVATPVPIRVVDLFFTPENIGHQLTYDLSLLASLGPTFQNLSPGVYLSNNITFTNAITGTQRTVRRFCIDEYLYIAKDGRDTPDDSVAGTLTFNSNSWLHPTSPSEWPLEFQLVKFHHLVEGVVETYDGNRFVIRTNNPMTPDGKMVNGPTPGTGYYVMIGNTYAHIFGASGSHVYGETGQYEPSLLPSSQITIAFVLNGPLVDAPRQLTGDWLDDMEIGVAEQHMKRTVFNLNKATTVSFVIPYRGSDNFKEMFTGTESSAVVSTRYCGPPVRMTINNMGAEALDLMISIRCADDFQLFGYKGTPNGVLPTPLPLGKSLMSPVLSMNRLLISSVFFSAWQQLSDETRAAIPLEKIAYYAKHVNARTQAQQHGVMVGDAVTWQEELEERMRVGQMDNESEFTPGRTHYAEVVLRTDVYQRYIVNKEAFVDGITPLIQTIYENPSNWPYVDYVRNSRWVLPESVWKKAENIYEASGRLLPPLAKTLRSDIIRALGMIGFAEGSLSPFHKRTMEQAVSYLKGGVDVVSAKVAASNLIDQDANALYEFFPAIPTAGELASYGTLVVAAQKIESALSLQLSGKITERDLFTEFKRLLPDIKEADDIQGVLNIARRTIEVKNMASLGERLTRFSVEAPETTLPTEEELMREGQMDREGEIFGLGKIKKTFQKVSNTTEKIDHLADTSKSLLTRLGDWMDEAASKGVKGVVSEVASGVADTVNLEGNGRFISSRLFEILQLMAGGERHRFNNLVSLISHTLIDCGLNLSMLMAALRKDEVSVGITTTDRIGESEMEPLSALLPLIVLGIGTIVLKRGPSSKEQNDCLSHLRNVLGIGAATFSLMRGFDWILPKLKDSVLGVATYFGLEYDPSLRAAKKLEEKFPQITNWLKLTGALEKETSIHIGITDDEYWHLVLTLSKIGQELESDLLITGLEPKLLVTITKRNELLRGIRDGIQIGKKVLKHRITPFCMAFFGRSEVGKSAVAHAIIYNLAKRLKIPPLQRAYYRSKTDHWDGYNGQWATGRDDFGQDTSDEDYTEFINLVSPTTFVLPMADLHSKGTPFSSDVFFYTTNTPYPKPKTIYCTQAVYRRRHLLIKVIHNNARNADGSLRYSQDWSHLRFHLYHSEENRRLRGANGVPLEFTYQTLTEFIYNCMLKHFHNEWDIHKQIGVSRKNCYPKPEVDCSTRGYIDGELVYNPRNYEEAPQYEAFSNTILSHELKQRMKDLVKERYAGNPKEADMSALTAWLNKVDDAEREGQTKRRRRKEELKTARHGQNDDSECEWSEGTFHSAEVECHPLPKTFEAPSVARDLQRKLEGIEEGAMDDIVQELIRKGECLIAGKRFGICDDKHEKFKDQFKCQYCNPAEEIKTEEILTPEQVTMVFSRFHKTPRIPDLSKHVERICLDILEHNRYGNGDFPNASYYNTVLEPHWKLINRIPDAYWEAKLKKRMDKKHLRGKLLIFKDALMSKLGQIVNWVLGHKYLSMFMTAIGLLTTYFTWSKLFPSTTPAIEDSREGERKYTADHKRHKKAITMKRVGQCSGCTHVKRFLEVYFGSGESDPDKFEIEVTDFVKNLDLSEESLCCPELGKLWSTLMNQGFMTAGFFKPVQRVNRQMYSKTIGPTLRIALSNMMKNIKKKMSFKRSYSEDTCITRMVVAALTLIYEDDGKVLTGNQLTTTKLKMALLRTKCKAGCDCQEIVSNYGTELERGTDAILFMLEELAEHLEMEDREGQALYTDFQETSLSNGPIKNVVRVRIPGYLTTATFIKGRVALINRHFLDTMEEDDIMELIQDNGNGGELIETSRFDPFRVQHLGGGNGQHENPYEDLAVYTFDKGVRSRRNIVGQFIRESDIPIINNADCAMLYRDKDGNPLIVTGRSNVHLKKAAWNQDKNNPVWYKASRFVSYSGTMSGKGCCGSLITLTNPRHQRRLVAIHCSFSGTNMRGEGHLVTQEILANVKFEDEVPPVPIADILREGESHLILPTESPLRFLGLAKASHAIYSPDKTKIQRSPLYGLFSPQKAPAVLSNRDTRRNPKYPGPLQVAFDSWTQTIKPFPISLVERSAEFVPNYMANKLQDARVEKKVLTILEACNGRPWESEYSRKLELDTSPGLPYVKTRPVDSVGKRHLFQLDDDYQITKLNTELDQAVKARIQSYKSGKRHPGTWYHALKDELRTFEKIEKSKTRDFCVGPLDYHIVFRMYFYQYIVAMRASHEVCPAKVGINPVGPAWTRLARRMKLTGSCFAGDYSKFDRTQRPEMMNLFVRSANKWYGDSEENQKIRALIFEDYVHRIAIFGNSVFEMYGGNPSGGTATSEVNCCVNVGDIFSGFCFLYDDYLAGGEYVLEHLEHSGAPQEVIDDWIEACQTFECGGTAEEVFDAFIEIAVYGDDVDIAVDDSLGKLFNFYTYQLFLGMYDITFTPESKDTSGKPPPLRPLEETTFLKRGFKPHPTRSGLILAPLDADTIREEINWVRSKDNIVELMDQILGTVLRDSYHHGPEFFTEMKSKLESACEQQKLKLPILNYKALDRDFISQF